MGDAFDGGWGEVRAALKAPTFTNPVAGLTLSDHERRVRSGMNRTRMAPNTSQTDSAFHRAGQRRQPAAFK